MKTFSIKKRRAVPAVRKVRSYVHHPLGPVQLAQQAEVRRIVRSTGAQAKLSIGQPNDKYEQEADRVADQVMAMPDPKLQRQPEDEEEEQTVQANSKPGAPANITTNFEAKINSLKGGGQSFDPTPRAFFEPHMKHDFSHVRIHTDNEAVRMNQKLGARAFTIGRDIYFDSQQYAPDSQVGRRLIAHELVHVMQQDRARSILSGQDHNAQFRHNIHHHEFTTIMCDRKRKIDDEYLSYSQHCGWIDWGHANPKAAKGFIAKIREGSQRLRKLSQKPSSKGQSSIRPTIDITLPPIVSSIPGLKWAPVTSVTLTIRLIRPLSSNSEILGVALGAFMLASMLFEHYQGKVDWLKNFIGMPTSKYAEEDLPSNLIGFYRAAMKLTPENVKQICKNLGKKESKEALKDYTFQSNPTFTPKRLPAGGNWPSEFSTIRPILPLPNVCSPFNVWESVRAAVQAGGGNVFYVIKPILTMNPMYGKPITAYEPPPVGDFPIPKPSDPRTA